MKGFIEVTRAGDFEDSGLPALVALKAILEVRMKDDTRRTQITLSAKLENYEGLPPANESFEVEESFEDVKDKMQKASGAKSN